ncbi:TPA: hypothetical protein ACKPYM_001347 [Stenotrophomonas maltophilia]
MTEHTSKVDVADGGPRLEKLPAKAGSALEDVGRLMVLLSLVAGVVGLFAFGRTPRIASWGGVSHDWNLLSVFAVVLSTGWALAMSWAVYRLGTALCWLERIGKKVEVE